MFGDGQRQRPMPLAMAVLPFMVIDDADRLEHEVILLLNWFFVMFDNVPENDVELFTLFVIFVVAAREQFRLVSVRVMQFSCELQDRDVPSACLRYRILIHG